MHYDEYASRFQAHEAIARIRVVTELREGDSVDPLFEAVTPGRKSLLITAGFHGDETAGPLTLLEHLPEIVDHARARDVGLRIFPCLNPSGFTDGTRYNRSGEAPNNDFLRYEIAPGEWLDELPAGQTYLRHVLYPDGPKETRALRPELERLPAPDAALDLHQDPWLEGRLSYAYVFGDLAPYLPLVAETERQVPLARSAQVDEGVHTDEHGLIVLHDGSVTDYMYRRGVPYTAALETTTQTPMAQSHAVNLIWIKGFIDLAARAPGR